MLFRFENLDSQWLIRACVKSAGDRLMWVKYRCPELGRDSAGERFPQGAVSGQW